MLFQIFKIIRDNNITIINNIIKIVSSSNNNNKEVETNTVKLIIHMISINSIKEMHLMIIFRDKMSEFKPQIILSVDKIAIFSQIIMLINIRSQ